MGTWIKAIAICLVSIMFSVVYFFASNYDLVWTAMLFVYLLIGGLLIVSFERTKRKIVDQYNPTKQEMKTVFTAMKFLEKKRDVVLQCKLRENIILMGWLLCSILFSFICNVFIHILLEAFAI